MRLIYLKIVKIPYYDMKVFIFNVGNHIDYNKTRCSIRKKRVMKRNREDEGMKR